MNAFDQQRLLSALMLLTMALFVGRGMIRSPRARRWLQIAAVSLFAAIAIMALIRAAVWVAQS